MKIPSQNRPLLERAMKRFDSSFFAYDLNHLASHLKMMNEVVGPDIKLWYACKANPLSAILKEFRNQHFGVDISGQGELEQVLNAGFVPSEIISTGPSKAKKFLYSLLNYGVDTIVLESLQQTYRLNEVAKEMGKKPKVLLRVQLSWKEGKSVLGGDEITAFGIEPDAWKKLDLTKCDQLDIQGFHCFQWGNIIDPNRLKTIWETITETIVDLSQSMNIELNILDLGGGFGVPYQHGGLELNFLEVTRELQSLKEKYGLKKIWMEIGRYAVASCGVYCTQIIDRKNVRGRELLITDGGINHIARVALTSESFPCETFRESTSSSREFYIHGPLCTALDKLGHHELPEDTSPGDWLVFHQAGAYGFTESMPYFLCHNIPGEIVIKNQKLEVLRSIKSSGSWLV